MTNKEYFLVEFFNLIFTGDVEDFKKLSHIFKEEYPETDLISFLKERSSSGNTLLHTAAQLNRLDFVSYLMENVFENADVVNFYGHTPLHWAAHNGSLEALDYMLVRSSDELLSRKTNKGSNILFLAAREGKEHIIDYLIGNPKTKILVKEENNDGKTAIDIAKENGYISISEKLSIIVTELYRDQDPYPYLRSDGVCLKESDDHLEVSGKATYESESKE